MLEDERYAFVGVAQSRYALVALAVPAVRRSAPRSRGKRSQAGKWWHWNKGHRTSTVSSDYYLYYPKDLGKPAYTLDSTAKNET